ncbi:competence/damage-inducible protein cinA [Bryocella elongata]|uniref:CinA-like protein n=1 Tax=Bryocella elongata TaxID=863522 RepID=A0A1H5X3U4_9BACT|nr:competence/damage-inducible protein A [Bryocella elongata]SEG06040.1 competence/damage-inducible protein cinA [Bryocella elongata]
MLAEIIAIGSEMLTPHRQDTNSLYLTAGLNALGVSVAFKTIVGDNRQHLTSAIGIALSRADIVVLSGGLGPTEDDLTRECVAEALGLGLHRDADVMHALQQRFAARRMAMPPNNIRQTEVLDGAIVLQNRNGSAPGQWLDTVYGGPSGKVHRKLVILLPGPPKELKPLFDEEAAPRLRQVLPAYFMASRMLRMALIPESQVDARCAPIYQPYTDVETTILAGSGEIQLHFRCTRPTQEEAEQRVDELAELIEREMGDDIFSSHGESLEEIVLLMLGMRGMKLSVAESCTGGLLASRLTAIPNASRVFDGGVVPYANDQKVMLCHVPEDLLEEHGAVSAPVARAMAEGIRAISGSSIGVSITGLAGPAGGEGPDADKPIGLVFIGLSDGEDTQVKQVQIPGDRDRVRLWATQHALELLRRTLE